MIPKTCPLNDRSRLQTILRSECTIEKITRKLDGCGQCPYGLPVKDLRAAQAQYNGVAKRWAAWAKSSALSFISTLRYIGGLDEQFTHGRPPVPSHPEKDEGTGD